MQLVSTNFAKTLVCKREYDVILWPHKLHISSSNDHHMPLLNTRIGRRGHTIKQSPRASPDLCTPLRRVKPQLKHCPRQYSLCHILLHERKKKLTTVPWRSLEAPSSTTQRHFYPRLKFFEANTKGNCLFHWYPIICINLFWSRFFWVCQQRWLEKKRL